MDPFDDLLRGVRATGVGLERIELTPPWALRFADGLTLFTPLRGEGRIGGTTVRVGDTAIVRGEATAEGDVPAVVVTGTYGSAARRLLSVLPPVIVVPDPVDECASLRTFLDTQDHGAQVVMDRLVDWLVVCTLREWFDRSDAPDWFHALGDDTVGPALRAMHESPDRPWTLVTLAREAGVSRTTLATRFTRLVGTPPLTYLTDWRMTLAADLLAETTATVAAVARQVGYADAFGFSSAFKRHHGISPTTCRKTCQSANTA
ncbi:AraC family transcriptional regulator [Actinophytocola algeriensis]|uniref:AraC-like DNA-binding protein n=1 Tax=Actinophytocola algeriensis TaxID=1768010 RepID=A0A7W7QAN2_9PSEU|nr:AraC family transcriptional regulator [Actinophytocola algeriensis]MBB4909953.1 AraC-like DNA-binding protein [Actinophytocola algeriensis]MBE1475943.1 AraC-like DNA-binding protein [Actinophytocola algeriensis]